MLGPLDKFYTQMWEETAACGLLPSDDEIRRKKNTPAFPMPLKLAAWLADLEGRQ